MKLIHIIISYYLFSSFSFTQDSLRNQKKIFIKSFFNRNSHSYVNSGYSITFSQSFYLNSNLPNLENQNGYYFPKGHGYMSSLLFQYNSKNLSFSTEPAIISRKEYDIILPEKEKLYSVLNDVILDKNYKPNQLRNTGLKVNYSGLSAGFGNWSQWWGPGIHNSLVLSNNAEGFYHYYLGTTGYQALTNNSSYKFKYMVSDNMQNILGDDFYLSAYFLNIKYNIFEFGISRTILSGGYADLPWTFSDATSVLISNKNIKYWDVINEYYLFVNIPGSGLEFFLDIGFPNRSYGEHDPEIYSNHGMGSNLGLRKKGAFGSDKLLFGFEYTRLLQGVYYNILPTSNWYDNIKYNYSSYKGKRWSAHSGSDSDDFLVFFGYDDGQKGFIYGLNYERHGVTYHFPPEVKLESRINLYYKRQNTEIHIIYENEFYQHYGFVDTNSNVWEETFEPGSLQRTQTILISLKHSFSF